MDKKYNRSFVIKIKRLENIEQYSKSGKIKFNSQKFKPIHNAFKFYMFWLFTFFMVQDQQERKRKRDSGALPVTKKICTALNQVGTVASGPPPPPLPPPLMPLPLMDVSRNRLPSAKLKPSSPQSVKQTNSVKELTKLFEYVCQHLLFVILFFRRTSLPCILHKICSLIVWYIAVEINKLRNRIDFRCHRHLKKIKMSQIIRHHIST